MPSTGRDPLKVVAGIIVDERGQVLVTQRPPGRALAGRWEFPGGKIEPHETAYAALVRELREELAIDVRAAHWWLRLRHSYPDKDVELDVWLVQAYGGIPHGCEGQAWSWCTAERLAHIDLLEADAPIVRALSLPRLYAITAAHIYGEQVMIARLRAALAAGVRLVQVREPYMEEREFLLFARTVVGLCHEVGARVLINGEPGWVETCGADGVHLNAQRLRRVSTRPLPEGAWLSASCHDANELAQARALGADFVVLGPVLPTRSHPNGPSLGWPRFEVLRAEAAMPVYALGGVRPQDAQRAQAAGAQGLAMISGLWEARSIAEAIAQAEPAKAR